MVPILARLSKHHAEAVKLRVKALNQTVRGRTRSRNTRKKPDIRDVFRDVEVSLTNKVSRSDRSIVGKNISFIIKNFCHDLSSQKI